MALTSCPNVHPSRSSFKRSVNILLFIEIIGLLLCCTVHAVQIPALTGRVNDTAGMLSPASVSHIDGLLEELERSDSTQIVVLTVPSLEAEVLEEFSMRVAEAWRIGQKGLDNGAILLVARNDRKVRIEVGYGLEGKLTDLVAGRIIANEIVPPFKEGRFDEGITRGVVAMIQSVRGEYTATGPIIITGFWAWLIYIMLILMLVGFLSSLFVVFVQALIDLVKRIIAGPRKKLTGYTPTESASSWSSSSSSCSSSSRSSFSSGGGRFGGGGASGSW
jgi:uncharacterized protein